MPPSIKAERRADAMAYIRDGFRSPAASNALAALVEEGDANGWG